MVLVADKLPLLRRFDYAPLAYPILFKAIVYTFLVSAVRLIEALIRYLLARGILGGGRFIEHQLGEFSWSRFIATQLWIFVLFLVWVTASELNNLFGDGELFRIFFTQRSSALKSTRRARIRLLTRLSRLTDAHPVAVLQITNRSRIANSSPSCTASHVRHERPGTASQALSKRLHCVARARQRVKRRLSGAAIIALKRRSPSLGK